MDCFVFQNQKVTHSLSESVSDKVTYWAVLTAKNFALDLHLEHGFLVCCKLSALRELLWDHVVVIWSECFGNKAWAEWKSLKIACLIMCTSFKRLKFHPGTFSISKSKVLIIWSMLEIVPHAHFTDAQTDCCGWEAILREKPSQERKVMSNIAPSSIHRVCREGKMAHLWSISY